MPVMFNRKITAALVRDLYESGAMSPAIVLTPSGWDVEPSPEGAGVFAALTQSDLEAFLDGYDDTQELSEDDAEAIAAGDGDHYAIAQIGVTGAGEWEVVFPEMVDGPDAWRECYAVDRSTARQVVAEPDSTHHLTRWSEVWVTSEGAWLRRWHSLQISSMGQWFEAVDAATIAEEAYDGQYDDRIAEDAPPLLQAARLARELVATCAAPYRSDDYGKVRPIDELGDLATEAFATARIISDLLRRCVTSDIRDERARAARFVIEAEGYDHGRAAQRLGIKPTTLSNLTRDPENLISDR